MKDFGVDVFFSLCSFLLLFSLLNWYAHYNIATKQASFRESFETRWMNCYTVALLLRCIDQESNFVIKMVKGSQKVSIFSLPLIGRDCCGVKQNTFSNGYLFVNRSYNIQRKCRLQTLKKKRKKEPLIYQAMVWPISIWTLQPNIVELLRSKLFLSQSLGVFPVLYQINYQPNQGL
jgi:hypothetical protein